MPLSADVDRIYRQESRRVLATLIRRRSRLDVSLDDVLETLEAEPVEPDEAEPSIEDDRLRLIFICCHPSLSPVIALNRAVAVAMQSGPAAGLLLIDAPLRLLAETPIHSHLRRSDHVLYRE